MLVSFYLATPLTKDPSSHFAFHSTASLNTLNALSQSSHARSKFSFSLTTTVACTPQDMPSKKQHSPPCYSWYLLPSPSLHHCKYSKLPLTYQLYFYVKQISWVVSSKLADYHLLHQNIYQVMSCQILSYTGVQL